MKNYISKRGAKIKEFDLIRRVEKLLKNESLNEAHEFYRIILLDSNKEYVGSTAKDYETIQEAKKDIDWFITYRQDKIEDEDIKYIQIVNENNDEDIMINYEVEYINGKLVATEKDLEIDNIHSDVPEEELINTSGKKYYVKDKNDRYIIRSRGGLSSDNSIGMARPDYVEEIVAFPTKKLADRAAKEMFYLEDDEYVVVTELPEIENPKYNQRDEWWYKKLRAFNNFEGWKYPNFFNESLNESGIQIYNVEYNYGDGSPGLAIGHVKVKANSEEEALEKAEKYASNKHYRDDSYYIEDSCKIVKSGYSNDPIVESSQKNEEFINFEGYNFKGMVNPETGEIIYSKITPKYRRILAADKKLNINDKKLDTEEYEIVQAAKRILRQEVVKKSNLNEDYDDYDEDDYDDSPEEMHKERYAVYFETQEGGQKYTIYHVYTDSTDDSYNELCDKRDNQLGMYSSYKELKDALKEKAEKIAAKQGWTVKSIDNLGEDDEYYRERNKY